MATAPSFLLPKSHIPARPTVASRAAPRQIPADRATQLAARKTARKIRPQCFVVSPTMQYHQLFFRVAAITALIIFHRHAREFRLRNDNVVKHTDAKNLSRFHDLRRDRNVRFARLHHAGRMIVRQDDRRCGASIAGRKPRADE